MIKKLVAHMRFHTPHLGLYRAARLAAALTYGEMRDRISSSHRKSRKNRLDFDQKYHVATAERRFVADMVGAENQSQSVDAIRYEPIEAHHVEEALDTLPINFSDFTLIDIGAGKGKVLFSAAGRPFKKMIGVEFDQEMSAIATENARTYYNSEQKCHDIQFVNADARKFELTDLPAVLYFYFPFRAALLQEVIDHFGESLRQCYLVWTTLEEAEAKVLDSCPHLSRFAQTEESFVFRGADLG